jgi:hypothetical protein
MWSGRGDVMPGSGVCKFGLKRQRLALGTPVGQSG